MEPQSIEIKSEYKMYEILALCMHFYNQGNYVTEVDNWCYSPTKFKFASINNILNEKDLSFTATPFEMPGGRFEFKFSNDKGDYKRPPKTTINMRYDTNRLLLNYRFEEKKWNEYEINKVIVTGAMRKEYDFTDEIEKNKFLDYQNKAIQKLKFYEEYSSYIINEISQSQQRYQPSYTFDYIYGYKSYIDNIVLYQKKGIPAFETLSQIVDCVVDHMQDGVTYNFKALKFRKNNYNSFEITINKSFRLTVFVNDLKRNIMAYNYSGLDPAFKIIIPMFEQLGGVGELKNVILHNRILTE